MSMPLPSRPRLHPAAAIVAGLIAALVFMMLEMMMAPMFLGQSPWAPPRMIAAMAMGRGALPPPAPFDFGVLMVAMMIHLMVSVMFALVFATFAKGRPVGVSITLGAVFGLAIYLFDFYVMTAVFPWFADARPPSS